MEAGAVHLGRVIVSPALRGTGAGRLLCEKLIARALESTGASRVTLRVYRDNKAARSLYASLGFSVVVSQSTAELLFMSAQADLRSAAAVLRPPSPASCRR